NSFPINGARQTDRLTAVLQEQILRLGRENHLDRLPPVLTFQSVVDFTVSTRAIADALYQRLPPNGSELVLFEDRKSTRLYTLPLHYALPISTGFRSTAPARRIA